MSEWVVVPKCGDEFESELVDSSAAFVSEHSAHQRHRSPGPAREKTVWLAIHYAGV